MSISTSIKRLGYVLLAASGIAVAGCQGNTTSSPPAPLVISQLPSPASDASGQPRLTTSSQGILLSWLVQGDSGSVLKFAERTATGWSAPQTVTEGPSVVTNWADVPSVIRLSADSLAAHWLYASGTSEEAYDVRVSLSHDNGRTWSPAITPHHDGTQTPHGFASLFAMPGGGFGAIWLDGRAQKLGSSDEFEGDMTVRAATFDANGTESPEVVVNKRTCECCQTAAAFAADGPIVAFRNRSADEIRDIYVSRLAGGQWTDPIAVHQDNWKISGCPINGPALSVRGRIVTVAWFTVQNGQGHTFLAFSADGGQSFDAPIRVDDAASLGRVGVELLADDVAAVSWVEFANQHAQFSVRRIDRAGRRSAASTVAGVGADQTSGFPRMALQGDELVFAWTDSSAELKVLTATARLR